ncbi:MAG: hypothetical protein KJ659_12585 [Actinobacteria bacterium]|nr:hypothetical protein [Actinomycetota bacterium]MBU1609456.1 hypothetical protein [Actinomycetota bacterium]MBU2315222.1 hypothetical protein [Actinomycetota bacterium]MBU2386306.1 hypothetical protein [Actinomycetota bacterium]
MLEWLVDHRGPIDTKEAVMTTESNDRSDQQSAAEPASAPAATSRGGTRTVLAATGIAVGSVLLLGLTFGGGVLLGTHLPDRGPGGPVMASEAVERLQERLDDRREERGDRRDWVREHRELHGSPSEESPEQ